MTLTPRVLSVIAVIGALTASYAVAQVGIADFDVDLSGNPIVADQRLLFEYGAAGLTLTKVRGQVGECDAVYANSNGPGGFGSPPNVVSLCPSVNHSRISENLTGSIRASFLTPVVEVCIDLHPAESTYRGVMRAYDAGNRLVDHSFSEPGVTQDICVAGEQIESVEFSGDQWDLVSFDNLTVDFGPEGGPTVRWVPGAANLAGAGGTRWRTDLVLDNTTDGETMECSVELQVRGESDPNPESRSVTVRGHHPARFDNVLQSLFGFEGAATLKLSCEGGTLHAAARTYNDDPDGTYGQFIPAFTVADAITPGRAGVIPLVRESENPASGFRTNVGLVNPTGEDLWIRVYYTREDGLGQATLLGLEPHQSIQINRMIPTEWGEYPENGSLSMFCITAGGVFFAFGSVVDNRSGDGIFVPAIVQ